MNRHRDLPVWQAARRLVLEVSALTRSLPHEERFVAITQLRRAAWSVANNIADGNARRGRGELRQFLNVAVGSLAEIDGMVEILPDLYAVDRQSLVSIENLRREITRGLFGILRRNGR